MFCFITVVLRKFENFWWLATFLAIRLKAGALVKRDQCLRIYNTKAKIEYQYVK